MKKIIMVIVRMFLFSSLFVCNLSLANASLYDVWSDFTVASNPSGVWSYGYLNGSGGAFNLLTTSFAGVEPSSVFPDQYFQAWRNPNGYPHVDHFDIASPLVYNYNNPATQITIPSDHHLIIHPSISDPVVVRFTAPAADTWTFQGDFMQLETSPHNPQFSAVFSYAQPEQEYLISPYTMGGQYLVANPISFSKYMEAGNTVDFILTPIGDSWADTTGLKLAVDHGSPAPVPEPGTMLLLGFGLAVLSGFRWRNKWGLLL